MLAVVKTPHIEINIKGDSIPADIIHVLRHEYGKKLKIINDDDSPVNIFETEWYKKTESSLSPGENMKIYRELHSMTQAELGERLGNLPRQHISNMEKGVRGISKENARKLAAIFKVPVDRFL
jgi:DNA-binding XRE family transcriptional regulator